MMLPKRAKYIHACKGYIFCTIFILQLFLSACEYTPHDPPLTLLDFPGEAPLIQVSLNNSIDTLKIYWITTFSYNVTGKNKILSVSIEFEGKEIHHYMGEYGQKFSFELDPSAYPNGTYPLKIEVITSSGTGSLAERLGSEGYLYQLEWPVIIDKTPTKKLAFISIDSLKEGVRIKWEKFKHPGFRYYKLMKTSPSFHGSVDLITYYNPDQTSFIDTTYFEGMDVNYIIELGGKTSGINSSETNSIQYSQLLPKPRITTISDFKVNISWDPPKKLHLLDYYYIHRDRATVTMFDESKIFEPDNKIRSMSVAFGAKHYFGILYVPRAAPYNVYTNKLKRAEIEFETGQVMPAYRYTCPVRNTDNLLLSKEGKIYKYNLTKGTLMDSIVTNSEYPNYFTLSPDGSFFGYSENGKFITRSTSDFRILGSMSNKLFSDNIGILLRLSVSDSGRLMMILENKVIFIFDILTGNMIAQRVFSGNWIVGAISPDGNYILTQEYPGYLRMGYYQITGDQIVNIEVMNGSGLKFFTIMPAPFGPDNNIYLLYNNKVEVRNISDFSVKKTLQYNGIQFIDYDNMKAVGSSTGNNNLGYLYDLNTLTLLKELPVYRIDLMIFHSNYLISSVGRKVLLQ